MSIHSTLLGRTLIITKHRSEMSIHILSMHVDGRQLPFWQYIIPLESACSIIFHLSTLHNMHLYWRLIGQGTYPCKEFRVMHPALCHLSHLFLYFSYIFFQNITKKINLTECPHNESENITAPAVFRRVVAISVSRDSVSCGRASLAVGTPCRNTSLLDIGRICWIPVTVNRNRTMAT